MGGGERRVRVWVGIKVGTELEAGARIRVSVG